MRPRPARSEPAFVGDDEEGLTGVDPASVGVGHHALVVEQGQEQALHVLVGPSRTRRAAPRRRDAAAGAR